MRKRKKEREKVRETSCIKTRSTCDNWTEGRWQWWWWCEESGWFINESAATRSQLFIFGCGAPQVLAGQVGRCSDAKTVDLAYDEFEKMRTNEKKKKGEGGGVWPKPGHTMNMSRQRMNLLDDPCNGCKMIWLGKTMRQLNCVQFSRCSCSAVKCEASVGGRAGKRKKKRRWRLEKGLNV